MGRSIDGRSWTPGRGWDERTPGDFGFVTPRLAVGGGLYDERDVRAVLDAGITHVATVARELESDVARLLAGRAAHLPNGTIDDGGSKAVGWFGRTIEFSVGALAADPAAKVLVHCSAGINRGPSAAYAVLRALGHEPAEALDLVLAARPFAGIIYAEDAETAVAQWAAARREPGRRRWGIRPAR